MSEMASLKKTKKIIFLLFFYIPSAVLLYIQRVVKIKILEHNITFFFDINTVLFVGCTGQYYQNNKACSPSDLTCVACDLPSCLSLPDGDHDYPSRLWKPDYITCDHNRTILPTSKCTQGYFHPLYENCTDDIADSKLWRPSN